MIYQGSNCHTHLATTIDRKAEFIQKDETCNTDETGEKDPEDRVHPQGENCWLTKNIPDIDYKPGHVEAGLYNHSYRADNGQNRLRSRFR